MYPYIRAWDVLVVPTCGSDWLSLVSFFYSKFLPKRKCPKLHGDLVGESTAWKHQCLKQSKNYEKHKTTLSNGYLGSRNDEERSEMRYVMRIAELSESSNL